jgi:autoinducer 2-binding protein LuxP
MTKLGSVQRRFLERFLRLSKPKVILYDFASPLTHWMNHPPLMYVGFDQKKATSMLASYLERQLPEETEISALVLPAGYLGHMRCDLFLDEMSKYNRRINRIRAIPDNKYSAFEATKILLKDSPPDFIFSCSQNISEGVVAALQSEGFGSQIQTNAWGLSANGIADLESRKIKVSVLFMQDDLSIAVAEAIKLDIEGRNMPTLYVANSTLLPAELDSESLRLMIQQAHHYSVELWQK